MAVKKVKSPTQLEYEKQLRRVKQFIYRAEKRGYTFIPNLIPKRPKKITEGSVRRLQKLTPDYLYSKATAKTEQGKTITGKQKRVEERIQSAKKGGHTRKRNIEKARKQREYKEREREQEEFERKRREKDRSDYTNVTPNEFSIGILTLQMLNSMISDYRFINPRGARALEELLTTALHEDEQLLYERLGNASERAVEDGQDVVRYYDWNTKGVTAYNSMYEIITGKTMTAEESARANDLNETSLQVDSNGYIEVDNSGENPWD